MRGKPQAALIPTVAQHSTFEIASMLQARARRSFADQEALSEQQMGAVWAWACYPASGSRRPGRWRALPHTD